MEFYKFIVSRTDGTSAPGGKHEKCRYFVLDIDHDPFAREAVRIYAQQCRNDYPLLANDIIEQFVMPAPKVEN